ncbi:penicillin-binding transpeptidase domain-containing protein, partial [Virgibacillus salexigens]|uniref:penicillin-binding transpeptidase domain-containing protein n=1 Tax=Virgibacillus massiliensis TaxID=1462526 RepID=UPI0022B7B24D
NAIGISTGKAYLDNMNLSVEDDGLAIALGGLSKGVTPAKLMESYSSLATNGNMVESHSIERIVQNGQTLFKANPEMKEVFTHQVAWNMTEMLEETVV